MIRGWGWGGVHLFGGGGAPLATAVMMGSARRCRGRTTTEQYATTHTSASRTGYLRRKTGGPGAGSGSAHGPKGGEVGFCVSDLS